MYVQLARLSSDDMNAVKNMEYISTPISKKQSGGFSLKFGTHKKKHGIRKERNQDEEAWQLSRFYPMIEELIESLHNGELSKEEYPCMNEPSSTFQSSRTNCASIRSTNSSAHSVRISKPSSIWARPRHSTPPPELNLCTFSQRRSLTTLSLVWNGRNVQNIFCVFEATAMLKEFGIVE